MRIQVNWRNHPMPNNRVIGGMLECNSCGFLFPCEFTYGRGERVLPGKECMNENKKNEREKAQEEVLSIH